MEEQNIQAPEHLSPRSRALWAELVPRKARSLGRRTLLQTALEALDRAEEARAELATTGLTTKTTTTGTIHANPLLKIERESRQQFARIWHELALHWDAREDGLR